MTPEDEVAVTEIVARLLKAAIPNASHRIEAEKKLIVAEIRGEV